MKRTGSFTEGPILSPLLRFTLPVLLALFLQAMYGAVFIVAYNVLGAMFRGLGDSKTPLLTVTIACFVNIAGDLLLVGACGLGVTGAALAIAAIVNGLGVIASAGVGVAEKLCGFIMLVPSAFGQSLSAFVAQNIGAGEKTRAKKAMLYGMGASLCCGIVLGWLSFFHGSLLAGLFARDAEVIAAARDRRAEPA